jgi:hypothetical protein
MPVTLDDTAFRAAAMALVHEARQKLPRAAWAAHALDAHNGAARILVEASIAWDGVREVTLLLDCGGPTQTILALIPQEGGPVREFAA